MAETRQREQRAAGEAIGVKEFVFLGHQDGELERTMELRAEVCLAIREDKPDVVFTNDPWPTSRYIRSSRRRWSGLDGVIAARDHLFFPEQLTGGLKHHRVSRVLLFGRATRTSGSTSRDRSTARSPLSERTRARWAAQRLRRAHEVVAKNTGSTWNLGPRRRSATSSSLRSSP